jgi:hypothetical protein
MKVQKEQQIEKVENLKGFDFSWSVGQKYWKKEKYISKQTADP